MTIKAIETVYNGYRFRSRLEARWAVFFDALGIEYRYELEGFDLGEAGWYLPDFWLPDLRLWVECKGELSWETREYLWDDTKYSREISTEIELAQAFRDAQEWPIALIVDTPGHERIHFFAWDLTDSSGGSYDGFHNEDHFWCISNGIPTLHILPDKSRERAFVSDGLCGEYLPQFTFTKVCGYSIEPIKQAQTKARQARFEHGETPR